MNKTHLHLLTTHLPIFGALLGALVQAFGLWRSSPPTVTAAYEVLAALGAAETVEHLPSVLESRIECHEDFAVYALISLLALGAAALAGLVLNARQTALAGATATVRWLAARCIPEYGAKHNQSDD